MATAKGSAGTANRPKNVTAKTPTPSARHRKEVRERLRHHEAPKSKAPLIIGGVLALAVILGVGGYLMFGGEAPKPPVPGPGSKAPSGDTPAAGTPVVPPPPVPGVPAVGTPAAGTPAPVAPTTPAPAAP